MRVIKPSWLNHSGEHKDFEVYSCHVSPDGARLATAGGDGHVRIWSTEAIYSSDEPAATPRRPRQLCHMSHHLGTIHAVRFSPSGRYLASGADDKIICIYHLDKGPPTMTFGEENETDAAELTWIAVWGEPGSGSEPPPVENWKTYKRLVGHENDVQDLAWSADSSLLVSVGLDSKIVIWSGHTFEKLRTLAVHQSHVKGVTFDPANKYFATASDDRTMKIFRFTAPGPNATQHDVTNNFVIEATITAPFRSSPLTTYFRRCSWSPDGNHIAAANGVNGPVSSVAIIERSRWDSEINLIGHEGPTEVCMFSPRLFHTTNPADGAGPGAGGGLVTVIASAGQDRTLSIWNTHTSRPVVIVQDLAGKSISDLSWTPDGQTVFASSLDGSVVAVKFSTGELGWVAQPEENDRALQKYGVSRKGVGLAEDVEGLQLENQSKAGESRAVESRMGALMGDLPAAGPRPAASKPGAGNGVAAKNGAAATTAEPDPAAQETGRKKPDEEEESAEKIAERVRELKARVTVGKDGKKRVAPLLISSSGGAGLSSLPQTRLVGATALAARGGPTDNGPVTTLDLSRPYDGLPKGGIAALVIGNKRRAVGIQNGAEGEDEDGAAGRVQEPGSGAGAATLPILIHNADGDLEPPAAAAGPRVAVAGSLSSPSASWYTPNTDPPEWLRQAITNPSTAMSCVRLGVPKVRTHILRSLERGVLQQAEPEDGAAGRAAAAATENVILEARNPVQPRDPSSIAVTKRGVLIWQDFLPRAVLLVTGNRRFWVAACEDGILHVWSPAGRRLLNPILVEAQPVILECRERWLLCITSVGMCYVWDIEAQRCPHPPAPLGPLLELAATPLGMGTGAGAGAGIGGGAGSSGGGGGGPAPTPGPGITFASLNSTGHVIVTLTNGDGFFYNRDMHTWQRVSESWWAVGSQYWNSNDSSVSALQSTAAGPEPPPQQQQQQHVGSAAATSVSAGIVPHLERHTTTEFLLKGRAYTLQRIIKTVLARDGFEAFESTVSIAHLENRVAAAMQLGAADDFRLYLFMYAKRIGSEGLHGKVEELLAWLVGGMFEKEAGGGSGGRGGAEAEGEARGWFSTGETVLGWERRELLKEVVMILGKYREMQRLVVQHARLLDMSLDGDQVMDES